MKLRYLLLTVVFLLACGTLPAATQATNPTRMPVPATETPLYAIYTPISIQASSRTHVLPISGCWNIRSGAGVAFPSVAVQCGGEVTFLRWSDNGFLEIVGGYICNRAVDGANTKECE